jgi:hypothetical protein
MLVPIVAGMIGLVIPLAVIIPLWGEMRGAYRDLVMFRRMKINLSRNSPRDEIGTDTSPDPRLENSKGGIT